MTEPARDTRDTRDTRDALEALEAHGRPARQPYTAPALHVFGSLADLTRQIGPRGASDAGNNNSEGGGGGGVRSGM